MTDKKIITVIGATGAQGGGVARAILSDPKSEFTVRAVTRDPNSDKAKALSNAGAQVIQADLDDIESLKKAFEGAYGAFCITNFWEHFSPEKEIRQAKNMADAAKAAGVKHTIWSSLDDTRKLVPLDDDRMPTLMGKYKVPHFDAKGESDKFFLNGGPASTVVHTVFYWDNMIHFGMGPKRGENGKLFISFPMGDKKLPAIAVEDIGKTVYGIFRSGEKYLGKTIGIAGEHLSGDEMAKALTGMLGEEVVFYDVAPEVYRSWGFPGADDMGNMFQFKRDFEDYYTKSRDIELTRSLNPELLDFQGWLDKYGSKIPVE
ncbi:MAG TPA: NmrA/HSCARG family protein [Bacteroidales bacterium]|nr:NmrA/HSCARG family protein [Bacteroidales bacterium]